MGNLLGAIGQAQPVSQFINTALRVGQFQQDSALRGMQTQREQLQLNELQKQQEYLDQTVDFRLTPFYLALPETARPQAEQMFQGLGAFDANYRGTRRQMYQAVGEIEKSGPALKTLMQPVFDAKAQAVARAFEAMRKNPNDPKLAEAYQTAQMEHAASTGKVLEHIKNLESQDAATFHNIPEGGTGVFFNKHGQQVGPTIQGAPKGRMIPIYDPSSPTEYSYGNPGTGEITEMAAPPPRNAAERDNPFLSWKEAFIESNGRKPSAKEVMDWHRAEGKSSDWQPKSADRKALDAALTDFYGNMVMSETDRMAGMKLTPGQVYQKMSPTLKDHKAKVSAKAWDIYRNSGGGIAPSDAVAQAWDAVPFAGGGNPSAGVSGSPAGFRDSGRTSGGKKVFVSPDGKNAWVAP